MLRHSRRSQKGVLARAVCDRRWLSSPGRPTAGTAHPPAGKQRLDKAIAAVADRADVEVTWHAYMIDPATKPEGEGMH